MVIWQQKQQWRTYWLKSIDNIISLVSSGRLVKNKIWLGGCSGIVVGPLVVTAGAMEVETKMIKHENKQCDDTQLFYKDDNKNTRDDKRENT